MNSRSAAIHNEKLLKYRTKNEMVPTFFSGIFLTSAINILTNSTSRLHIFEMLAMVMMFASCVLFFIEASKIHELQVWYGSLTDENKKKEYFLNSATGWDLGNWKGFYKKIIVLLPVFAWITGSLSLLIYFLSTDIEKFIVQIGCICQLK